MRINHKTRVLSAFSIIGILLMGFSGTYPTARTGAPGETTCQSCHANNNNFSAGISLFGPPSTALGGDFMEAVIEVSYNSGSPVEAGFSIVAIDDTNELNAGVWDDVGEGAFISASVGGSTREYWGHDPSMSFSGESYAVWVAGWTAPNITDDVTFYFCAVVANGNNNANGDDVICDEHTISITAVAVVEVMVGMEGDVTCHGGNDGTAEAIATLGTPPYVYEWDNGESTSVATMLDAGTHTVTVTDDNGNGNTATGSIEINEPDEITISENSASVSCNGGDDAEIDLDPSGGNGNYTCDWNFGGTGCFQDDLEPGGYLVTVTDANGCTEGFDVLISEPSEMNLLMSSTDASAPGAMDGTATVMVSGGTPGYDYEWSNGDSGSTITGLTAGTYIVTVSDDNDCEETNSVVVSGGPCALAVTPMVSDVSCYGTSSGMIGLSIMGATNPITYAWSNNTSQANLTNVAAGSYSVTVTDAANCSQTITGMTISQPDSLDVTLLQMNNSGCPGTSTGALTVAVNGGVGDYVLSWSNGLTNDTLINGIDTLINIQDTLTNLAAGLYAYNLIDGNGCVKNGFYQIATIDSIAPTLVLQQAIIELDANGQAPAASFSMIDAGSFDNCGNFSNNFSAGPFTCDDIGVNTYTVFATDSNNNVSSQTTTLQVIETIPPVINCANSSVTSASCGAVTYTLPTATDNCDIPSVTLLSGLASGSVFPVGASTVSYRATDACGNSADCSFVVTVNVTLAANVIITPASCGVANGVITANASGGTAPFQYSLDGQNYQVDNLFTDLAIGTYTVYVSDATGCQVTEVGEIVDTPSDLAANVTTMPATCAASTGSISINPTGGVPPYTTAPFGLFQGGLASGNYTITVTDNTGCQIEETVTIGQTDGPTITLSSTSDDCSGTPQGTVRILAVGGTPPYVASVNMGSPLSFDGDTTLMALSNGTYTISVSDANNCASQQTVTVDTPPAPMVSLPTLEINCAGDSVLADFSALYPDFSFAGYPRLVSAGTYSVIVTDNGNGCTVASQYSVTEPTAIVIGDLITTVVDGCDFDPNDLTAEVTGGVPPYQISYINEGPTIQGPYRIEVRDNNGCISQRMDSLADIILPPALESSVTSSIDCSGSIVNITVSGGCPPYTNSTVFDAPGNHTVVVTDAIGAQDTLDYTIEEYFAIDTANVVVSNSSSPMVVGGVTLDIIGGTAPYQYTWTDMDTIVIGNEAELSYAGPGEVTLTVVDANGCQETYTFFIDDISATIETDEEDQLVVLYPNPTLDNITVEFLEMNADVYTIFDHQGRVHAKDKVNGRDKVELTLAELDAGIYLIKIENEDQVVVKQFLKL